MYNCCFRINEEVPCLITRYNSARRLFTVKPITDDVTGYLYLKYHPIIYRILINAINNQTIIPLRFQRKDVEGKLLFRYVLSNPQTQEVENREDSDAPVSESPVEQETQDQLPIQDSEKNTPEEIQTESFDIELKSNQPEFNKVLLDSLLTALGDIIDTEEKYNLAVNLLTINKRFELSTTLSSEIYSKCTQGFKMRLWMEDILPYCSNSIVKDAWQSADAEGRQRILGRLGIEIDNVVCAPCSGVQDDEPATEDNSEQTTEQLERRAVQNAVREIRTRQNTLTHQRQTLESRSEGFSQQRATLKRQLVAQNRETVQRMANATSDAERQEIQQQSEAEQTRISNEIQEVNTQQQEVQNEICTISDQIENAQSEINTVQSVQSTQTVGGRGKLKINLKWETIDDVDLHVYDPDNNHIFYGSKLHRCQGIVGQLDIDANAGSYTTTPQENIFWNEKAPVGHYKVDVHLFTHRSGAAAIPFTVTVYPEKGEPKIFNQTLTREKENIHLFEFDYDDRGIHYKS